MRFHDGRSGENTGRSTGPTATLPPGLAGLITVGVLLLIGLWPLAVFTRRTTFDNRSATWNYATTPLGWGLTIGWWAAVLVICGGYWLWRMRNRKCALCGMPRYQHIDGNCPPASQDPALVVSDPSGQVGMDSNFTAGQQAGR